VLELFALFAEFAGSPWAACGLWQAAQGLEFAVYPLLPVINVFISSRLWDELVVEVGGPYVKASRISSRVSLVHPPAR
jgi:hypothetical protein